MIDRICFYTLLQSKECTGRIPVSDKRIPLALINLEIEAAVPIFLYAAIGWEALEPSFGQPATTMLFKIWRNTSEANTLVYSVKDSAEPRSNRNRVTSFCHIDSSFDKPEAVVYTLTAESPDRNGAAQITGYVSFVATIFAKDINGYDSGIHCNL